MKKIGVLFGMEDTFPGALVERINSMGATHKGESVTAEAVCVGAVSLDTPAKYAVIVDRISHDIPFYRAYLKHAVLSGTAVINNPFWWSADDKFFNYSLASRIGVAVPRTVILPHKHFPPLTAERSCATCSFLCPGMRFLRRSASRRSSSRSTVGGWRDVYHVHNPDDFFRAYDQSRDLCMMLQGAVNFTDYFRCYVVGQREVRIMPYDPRRPHHERYLQDPPAYAPKLLERVRKDALTLCNALGYDLNTVEFAVEDGIPYAIDFMNPAPDADRHSVGAENFEWIVDAVSRLAIEKAQGSGGQEAFHWGAFLNGSAPAQPPAKKAAAEKAPAKKAARKSAAKSLQKEPIREEVELER